MSLIKEEIFKISFHVALPKRKEKIVVKKVLGTRIKIFDREYFYHVPFHTTIFEDKFHVSDLTTGCVVDGGDTIAIAIGNTERTLKAAGEKGYKKAVARRKANLTRHKIKYPLNK